DVLHAFWLNVKLFCIAEVLILPLALLLAIVRSLPGPVFFPLRVLAIAYTDFFRGVPTILVIVTLGFGAPALQLQGVPQSTTFWARSKRSSRHRSIRRPRSTSRRACVPHSCSSRSRSRWRASRTGSSPATAAASLQASRCDRDGRGRPRSRERPQVVRKGGGPPRHRPRSPRAPGRLPDRLVGLGQVHASPLRQ